MHASQSRSSHFQTTKEKAKTKEREGERKDQKKREQLFNNAARNGKRGCGRSSHSLVIPSRVLLLFLFSCSSSFPSRDLFSPWYSSSPFTLVLPARAYAYDALRSLFPAFPSQENAARSYRSKRSKALREDIARKKTSLLHVCSIYFSLDKYKFFFY